MLTPQRAAQQRARAFLNEYLSQHPCIDCGEADLDVLQFDHRQPTATDRVVTGMLTYSIDSITAEIEKCDVRCANCHTRRTRQQQQTGVIRVGRPAIAAAGLFLLVLLAPALAHAQAACVPDGKPAPITFGRSMVTFQSPSHTAVDPAGNLLVQDYFGEVRVNGSPDLVTNFTIPKTSVTPVTGTGIPAGCFQTLLPAMGSGLLPTAIYELTLLSRNPQGTLSPATAKTTFFLAAGSVPASPTNIELVTP